jgi:hypothetical protein
MLKNVWVQKGYIDEMLKISWENMGEMSGMYKKIS